MGSQVGCLPGRSIIPDGIPGGIPPISGGIPPGINLGSQVGLAGSRLTFLPGEKGKGYKISLKSNWRMNERELEKIDAELATSGEEWSEKQQSKNGVD